jgi:hypothetical protein
MGFFRDLKLYIEFSRTIKKNKVAIESNFGLRIDRASRLYTVLNIPEDFFGEPYNLRKSDIETISENYIREYIGKMSEYLNSLGLSELYDFYEPIKKIDKYSYLIVIGFKPFDSVLFNKILWLRLVPILASVSIISLIIYLIFN